MKRSLTKGAPARDFGKRPELRWLLIHDLYVDPTYQRTLESRRSQALITKITAGFSWSRFGAVLVTSTKRGYAVLDGQHRVEAARAVGIRNVPCVIIDAGSTAEQALAFVAANMDRVVVNPFALHHALIAAGDADALEIDNVCRCGGVSIPRYPIPAKNLKPGQTLALGAIASGIKTFGPSAMIAALSALADAFKNQSGRLRAPLIKAAARLLIKTKPADLIAVLRSKPEEEMSGLVYRWNHENGESQEAAWIAVLAHLLAGGKPEAIGRRNVLAELRATEALTKLEKPVKRRCPACLQIFDAIYVGQQQCGCRSKRMAAE
jgi:hypothetical protein